MTVSSPSSLEIDRFAAQLETAMGHGMARLTTQPLPTIRCSFRRGQLWVLVETSRSYPQGPKQAKCFRGLARHLHRAAAKVDWPEELAVSESPFPVRFFLRQRGAVSPYAVKDWCWQPAMAIAPIPAADSNHKQRGERQQAQGDGAVAVQEAVDPAASGNPALTAAADESITTLALACGPEPAAETLTDATPDAGVPNDHGGYADAVPEPSAFLKGSLGARLAVLWHQWPWRSLTGLVMMGFTVGTLTYGISRPCLIGRCDRRQTASTLHDNALATLQAAPTQAKIRQAQADLTQAVQLLAAIPPWSPHHTPVQADLDSYRQQLSELSRVIAAQKIATEASTKSQDPPHPLPLWVDVHLLWQQAVTELQHVPTDSALASLVRAKQAEYQANHTAIGRRMQLEERAEAELNRAFSSAERANLQTEQATTLADWQGVQQTWQQAVQILEQIPQSTLAHKEAKMRLEDYRLQLSRIRTRVNFEKASDRSYQASLNSAAEATAAEQAQQWEVAANMWRRAQTYSNQVPTGTAYAAAAQSQHQRYQRAITRTQAAQIQATARAALAHRLRAVCAQTVDICTVDLREQSVSLTLQAPYDSAFRQFIATPSTATDWSPSPARAQALLQTLMQLGNQAQLPINLVDTTGNHFATYRPEYGGFARD